MNVELTNKAWKCGHCAKKTYIALDAHSIWVGGSTGSAVLNHLQLSFTLHYTSKEVLNGI